MRFSEEEIQAARELKALGLAWEPKVGNYVFDAHDSVEPESPFQDGVYFILNYDHFMRLLGGVDRFTERMVWLPTWEDLRGILRDLGIADATVVEDLSNRGSFDSGTERLALYHLLVAHLRPAST
ncbi:MAG: hypothetical protein AAFX06_25300 [Planctomycetota bacterium]